jgi:molybdopterin molybdotransferase
MAPTFEQARERVLREVRAAGVSPPVECVAAAQAAGRVLAEEVVADRDYPPFARSARDGYAVRSADLPGEFRIIGEARAGGVFPGRVGAREAVEIMTGAPLPEGADQVVMVEHGVRAGDRVTLEGNPKPGGNFSARGEEAAAGSPLLGPGRRLDFARVALLAMVGRSQVRVFAKPRVAIVPTGDELVEAGDQPQPFQIRNSNAWALAAQVQAAGGAAEICGIARDNYDSTRALVERGLSADLLLLSGGVSVGKYDLVERVLADLGAEFFFTEARIQPGRPVVFGRARGRFFFGLPGNPASTMATFAIFARAAVELLGGVAEPALPLTRARLTCEFRQKTGLTRLVPAGLSPDGASVTPEPNRGSGDIPALARANAYLVTDPERERWAEGDDIRVLMR